RGAASRQPCALRSLRHDLRPRRYQRRGSDRVRGTGRAAGSRDRDGPSRGLSPAGALALKLVLTPILVGAASLAGRRWGSAVGGWLIGIPFTSGPIAFFLALSPGPRFAAEAALGIMAGAISQAAFCLAYAWTAQRSTWIASMLAATAAFSAATITLNPLRIPGLAFLAVLLPEGIAPAFALAIVAAAGVQAGSLVTGRRLGLA